MDHTVAERSNTTYLADYEGGEAMLHKSGVYQAHKRLWGAA